MVNFDISKVTLGELKANGVVESYVGYEQVLNAVYAFVDTGRLDSEEFVEIDDLLNRLIGSGIVYSSLLRVAYYGEVGVGEGNAHLMTLTFDGKLIGDLVTYWEYGEDDWDDSIDHDVYVRNWFTGHSFDVTGEFRRYLESQLL